MAASSTPRPLQGSQQLGDMPWAMLADPVCAHVQLAHAVAEWRHDTQQGAVMPRCAATQSKDCACAAA